MKKILQILLLSLGIVGCSSLELTAMPSSETEVQRILSLGLSHDENLVEASKLSDSNMSLAVTNKLQKYEDQKNRGLIEANIEDEYAEKVEVLDDNSKYIASVISGTKTRSLLGDPEKQDYFLQGIKDKNNNSINHKLNFSITYNSDGRRNYLTANICDKWQGCENDSPVDIALISSKAFGCSSFFCDYNEIVELDLSDDFLRESMEEGFSVSFNSKSSKKNKITVSSNYIKGYLKVAN